MVIECVNCGVKYKIDESRLDAPNKKVKCSKCGEVFTVSIETEMQSSTQNDFSPPGTHSEQQGAESGEHTDTRSNQEPDFSPGANDGEGISTEFTNPGTVDNSSSSDQDRDDSVNGHHKDAGSQGREKDLFRSPFDPESVSMSDVTDPFDTNKERSFDESTEDKPDIRNEFKNGSGDLNTEEEKSGTETVELIDWESLEVDEIQKKTETAPAPVATDSTREVSDEALDLEDSQEYKKEGFKKKPEAKKQAQREASLAPDFTDVLTDFSRASAGGPPPGSVNSNPRAGSRHKKRGFFSSIFSGLLYLLVLTIFLTAAVFSLVTFDVLPGESVEKYIGYVSTYIPEFDKDESNNTDQFSLQEIKGKWINTRNGYMYVVYGQVINEADKTVNYIKLRSTFSSAGSELYQQDFYSGNTLTLKELKNSSPARLREKLNRREGDVDLQDIDTFAGRNYDIQPGEKVPFYTFYLSGKKILGLKYNIKITDFVAGTN